jgi:hypothetical protein
MLNVNPRIEQTIAAKVLAAEAEHEKREPSGRLSASRLGWPLQWMMLHRFKVPRAPMDEYTLRKFQRGHDVEDRVMAWLEPGDDKMQIPVEYRGVVGVMDVELEYPIEVKSVTNMAFKHKMKEGPSLGHRLQGMLYAKARGFDKFGVAYVASDDYRVLCFEEPVTDEVDAAIDAYEAQVALGTVPVFEAKEKWQSMTEYCAYPEWLKLDEAQIAEKLAEHLSNVKS